MNVARALLLTVVSLFTLSVAQAQGDRRQTAIDAMRKAAGFYREHAASHGGYVYHYSLDFSQRWGEGVATTGQVWVQPPGTPTVGMAMLNAYRATGDAFYLDAATDAATAIVYGQLKSGGWTNSIDFDPSSRRTAAYRNGRGKGKDNSSLDDGQTQSAIQLLIRVDEALEFKHKAIHQSATIALDALLDAQFPNGAFPQVWTGPVQPHPSKKASYPKYDWRTEGRIKNYWDMYTLNDNVLGYVADTLIDAHTIYDDEKYLAAVARIGDFLLLSQMPEPQPGWAQQYNYDMHPIWARKFEPPGVSGDETQETIETLIKISWATGDKKYLEPIPRAAAWLKRSVLRDGQVARYYELQSNRPLYMSRRGDTYSLTYDDRNLPSHYGWKTPARLAELGEMYRRVRGGEPPQLAISDRELKRRAASVIKTLDSQGRWVSTFDAKTRLVGQAKMPPGSKYLSSQLFSDNLNLLSEFVASTR